MDKSTTILQQHPSTLLGLKLTTTQQVVCCFLVPAIVNCIIYIIDFASNVAVVQRHFEEGNIRWAISTLLIMYVPSLVYFTLSISYVEIWNEQYKQSTAAKWFLARLLYLVAFPILGIYRYAKIIFWSIESLFQRGREEALRNVTRPSHIELYFFLQAYLQGLPQAVLQLSVLFTEHSDNRETDSMQVLCIASSLMIVAITTVSFQRFESQRLLGRLKPWSEVTCTDETTESNEQQIAPQIEEKKSEYNDIISDDEQSTPYLQPRVITDDQVSCEISSISLQPNDDVVSVVQVISGTHPQGYFHEDKTNISQNGPQELTVNTLPEKSAENDELLSIPLAPPPPIPRTTSPTMPPSSIKKPLEFPTRKYPVKGLEQDDLLGKSVSFLMWLLFLASRTISLVSFFHFYPWAGLVISVVHYAITLLLIHKCFKTIPTVLVKVSLALIFCFCLIERKVRFTKVYLLYTIFFFAITLENMSISTAWYVLADWDGWWYNYTYFLVCGCQAISILCILMYFYMLKPNSRIFYPSEST